MGNFQEKVSFIWDLADLLRGTYKRNEYQKVILPFTVLRRFDCVLSDSKKEVLEVYNKYKDHFENMEPILLNAAKDKNGNPLGTIIQNMILKLFLRIQSILNRIYCIILIALARMSKIFLRISKSRNVSVNWLKPIFCSFWLKNSPNQKSIYTQT